MFVRGVRTGLRLIICDICIYYICMYVYECELAHHGHEKGFCGDVARVECCDLLGVLGSDVCYLIHV